jgi:alkylresorcinol/alkylpyrone synthase
MGFRSDMRRTPIFGLGCSGGVAALSRANEYCRAYPKQRALVVSLEICSLVFSTQAMTPTDLVGASLFGDGAAAVIVGGDEVAFTGAKTLFSRSLLFPGTEEVMGWRFTGDGMRLVLSEEVPSIVREKVKPALESFVLSLGLTLSRLHYYILHPGGPKVLEAYQEVFGLTPEALEPIRNSLRRYGNLSSAAVLFILDEFLTRGRPKAGEKGIVIALGPGFGAEMMLLGW